MKILIISNLDPVLHFGGVEFVTLSIARAFVAAGHEVRVLSRGKIAHEYTSPEGIHIHQVSLTNLPGISDIVYAYMIRKYSTIIQPDIVIDNGSLAFMNSMHIPTISIVHGTNMGNARSIKIRSCERLLAKIYRLWWASIQGFFLRRVYAIVAISEKISDEIIQYYGIQPQKIHIIHNGTFIDLSPDDRIQLIRKEFKKNIIFVSTNHPWKGIAILEKLAQGLPEYSFSVCGHHYTPTEKNIRYLGALNTKELEEAMIMADAFFFPSQYEGQSLAVLDAMALGLPIVGGVEIDPRLGDSKKIGFLTQHRTHIVDYIDFFRSLEKDPALFQAIQSYNIDLMKDYTWEKQGKKYLELLSTLSVNPGS